MVNICLAPVHGELDIRGLGPQLCQGIFKSKDSWLKPERGTGNPSFLVEISLEGRIQRLGNPEETSDTICLTFIRQLFGEDVLVLTLEESRGFLFICLFLISIKYLVINEFFVWSLLFFNLACLFTLVSWSHYDILILPSITYYFSIKGALFASCFHHHLSNQIYYNLVITFSSTSYTFREILEIIFQSPYPCPDCCLEVWFDIWSLNRY